MKTIARNAANTKASLIAYASIGAAVAFIMALTLGMVDAPEERTVASNQAQIDGSVAQ